MPKQVPIITDWSEAERIALVRKWHPADVYEVTAEPQGNNDQEAWYKVVATQTVCNARHDVTKGNTYSYKLTVETCLKELGKR